MHYMHMYLLIHTHTHTHTHTQTHTHTHTHTYMHTHTHAHTHTKQFPYCDGSHNAHNKDTGDNVGPLKINKPQKTGEKEQKKDK